MKKKIILILIFAILTVVSGVCLVGFADDSTETENEMVTLTLQFATYNNNSSGESVAIPEYLWTMDFEPNTTLSSNIFLEEELLKLGLYDNYYSGTQYRYISGFYDSSSGNTYTTLEDFVISQDTTLTVKYSYVSSSCWSTIMFFDNVGNVIKLYCRMPASSSGSREYVISPAGITGLRWDISFRAIIYYHTGIILSDSFEKIIDDTIYQYNLVGACLLNKASLADENSMDNLLYENITSGNFLFTEENPSFSSYNEYTDTFYAPLYERIVLREVPEIYVDINYYNDNNEWTTINQVYDYDYIGYIDIDFTPNDLLDKRFLGWDTELYCNGLKNDLVINALYEQLFVPVTDNNVIANNDDEVELTLNGLALIGTLLGTVVIFILVLSLLPKKRR